MAERRDNASYRGEFELKMLSAEFNEMMRVGLLQARNDEAVSLDEAFEDLLQGL